MASVEEASSRGSDRSHGPTHWSFAFWGLGITDSFAFKSWVIFKDSRKPGVCLHSGHLHWLQFRAPLESCVAVEGKALARAGTRVTRKLQTVVPDLTGAWHKLRKHCHCALKVASSFSGSWSLILSQERFVGLYSCCSNHIYWTLFNIFGVLWDSLYTDFLVMT